MLVTWASEGGGQGGAVLLPWSLKFSAKNVVFLVSSEKKQISPSLPPLQKNFWKNSLVALPGKNPSDAHGWSWKQ